MAKILGILGNHLESEGVIQILFFFFNSSDSFLLPDGLGKFLNHHCTMWKNKTIKKNTQNIENGSSYRFKKRNSLQNKLPTSCCF